MIRRVNARMISGRYQLGESLGCGGSGEVFKATDSFTGGTVAIKLLHATDETQRIRSRREMAALRLLRLPGVVRLIDDGVEDLGRPFFVMEVVEGSPFTQVKTPWPAVQQTVVQLLETLARVHRAGVVHRDLKPSNVLVDSRGRPTILDFGIALGPALGDRLTRDQGVVGTPRYLAPEQILGKPVDARTDLFALGVMLYEALAGAPPHTARELEALLDARLRSRPPRLDLSDDVPENVASMIDRMLAPNPGARPASAEEILLQLDPRNEANSPRFALPQLGPKHATEALVDAARNRRSLRIGGAPGSGRSRALREAAAILRSEGVHIEAVLTAQAPLASLAPVLGDPRRLEFESLQAAIHWASEQLANFLQTGAVLLLDDAIVPDRWSLSVIEASRARGSILEGVAHGTGELELAPLEVSSLFPLFSGPDRLFHLVEDAANELHRRTGGSPALIEQELGSWIEAGLARWNCSKLEIERSGLARLGAGLVLNTQRRNAQMRVFQLDEHQTDLTRWIELAWPNATRSLLTQLFPGAAWLLDAALEDLERWGAISRGPGDSFLVDWPVPEARALEENERQNRHGRIADRLAPGTAGRLYHLISAGAYEVATEEARFVAAQNAAEGRLSEALAALGETLRLVRAHRRSDCEYELLSDWIDYSLADGRPRVLNEALYELGRTAAAGPISGLESLVRAALATSKADGDQALSILGKLPPFERPALELWRHAGRAEAAHRAPIGREEEILADVETWVRGAPNPEAQAKLYGWQGRYAYRRGRFADAARLHRRASEIAPRVVPRITACLNCASSLMEAFQLEDARDLARAAKVEAARIRHAHCEGRAEWLIRATTYRLGERQQVDEELIEATHHLELAHIRALVTLTEAAISWSAGARETAGKLALAAAGHWQAAHTLPGKALALALALDCGEPQSADALAWILEISRASENPSVNIQALGLLARNGNADEDSRRTARLQADSVARAHWKTRMEVLSVEESLEALN